MPSRRRILAGVGSATATAVTAGCLGHTTSSTVTGDDDDGGTNWWPSPGFDQWASGYNPRPVGPREGVRERWSLDIVQPTGRPTVADGTAYLPTGQALRAVDAASGEVRWQFRGDDGTPLPIGAPVHDGVVYVGASDGSGVSALGTDSGDRRWQFVPEGYSVTAVVADDDWRRVFVGDSDGIVYALDPETGSETWRTELFGSVTTLAVGIPEVLVGTRAGEVYALSRDDGDGLWQQKLSGAVRAVATGNGQPAYVSTLGGATYGLDSESVGERLWSLDVGHGTDSFVVAGYRSLYATGGPLTAIHSRKGQKRWTAGGRFSCGPAGAGDTLYVADEETVAGYALGGGLGVGSLRVGAKRWSHAVNGTPRYGLSVADGAVFVLTQGSESTAYALESV